MTTRNGPCLVLHRAITNAGDFLIRDRTLALISHFRPDLSVVIGRAWEPLKAQFDDDVLSSARAIVICGGPGYQPGMYPRLYPLAPLDELAVPVFLLALGTYARVDPSSRLRLDEASMALLRRAVAAGGRLGARDRLTERFLAGLGFTDAVMAGDPAWYDVEWLDRTDYGSSRPGVAFTPPANPLFHAQGLRLLRALAATFGAASTTVVFHRGVQRTFADICAQLGIRYLDIAGGADGFRVFDEAGCHVGYRVHAHLYCLSHATPSYLVAEDSRGLGVHETLGRLGVEGMGSGGGALATTVWSAMPRLGSQRTRITRRFGSLASRMAHLVDVGPELLGQLEADRKDAHARHAQAKQEIRATLPAMEGMLEAIP